MNNIVFKAIMATLAAIAAAVTAGGDRFKLVLVAIRLLSKDAQRKSRAEVAHALYEASTSKNPDALMAKAFEKACKRAEEALKASFIMASAAAIPEMRVEPISPLVLPMGEGHTMTPIHTIEELLKALSCDKDLMASLLKQGANRAKAKGLVGAAQFALANREVSKQFADNLMFLGKYATDEHSIRINGKKYNLYAISAFETVKAAAAGEDVGGGELVKGLLALAQYAAEAAVDHANIAATILPSATRFWVAAGGGVRPTEEGHEGAYGGADDTLVRTPFFGVVNMGQNPTIEDVADMVQAQWEECGRVATEFMAYAVALDAMLGKHAVYKLRDRTEGDLADVINATKDRIETRRQAQLAKLQSRAQMKARDNMDMVAAATIGLNAAQRAQVKKMAMAMVEAKMAEDAAFFAARDTQASIAAKHELLALAATASSVMDADKASQALAEEESIAKAEWAARKAARAVAV